MTATRIPVRSALRAIDEAYRGGNPNAIREFLGKRPANRLVAHKAAAPATRPRGGSADSAWKAFQGTPEYKNQIDKLTAQHGIKHKDAFNIAYTLFAAGYKAHQTWQEQQPAAAKKGDPRRRQRP